MKSFGTRQAERGFTLAELIILIAVIGILSVMALPAFLRYYQAGHVDLKIAALIVVGLLVGGWFGGGWAQHLSGPALRKGFAVFMVLAGLKMFFDK